MSFCGALLGSITPPGIMTTLLLSLVSMARTSLSGASSPLGLAGIANSLQSRSVYDPISLINVRTILSAELVILKLLGLSGAGAAGKTSDAEPTCERAERSEHGLERL